MFTLMSGGVISDADSSFRITFLRFGQAKIRVRIAHPTPAKPKPAEFVQFVKNAVPENWFDKVFV